MHAGPTARRLFPAEALVGRRFLELFELRRPRGITGMAGLRDAAGGAMALRLRSGARTALKGLAVPIAEGAGLIVNLSFGISAVEAVGRYALSAGDFPPTDLTVEMLYLVEAKEAVLSESRRLNQRLQGARIAAEEQAFTDTLTGLKNRRAMDHVLTRHGKAGTPFSVMLIDLDWFKEVNDTHGHAAGDHVLQVAARILVEAIRSDDTAVRAGGDEFVLILPRLTDPRRLAALARRLLARLDRPIPFEGRECRVSASIGIARSDLYDPVEPVRMLADADAALYRSKRAGRGCFNMAVQDGRLLPEAPAG